MSEAKPGDPADGYGHPDAGHVQVGSAERVGAERVGGARVNIIKIWLFCRCTRNRSEMSLKLWEVKH